MKVIERLYSSTVDSFQGFPELGLNRTTEKEHELENSINIKLKGFIPKDVSSIIKHTEICQKECTGTRQ